MSVQHNRAIKINVFTSSRRMEENSMSKVSFPGHFQIRAGRLARKIVQLEISLCAQTIEHVARSKSIPVVEQMI